MTVSISGFPPSLMILGAGVFVCIGIYVAVGGDGSEKRLRERITGLREVRSPLGDQLEASILNEAEKRTIGRRLAGLLGYRADLPAAYAPALKIVVPIAISASVGVFKLFGSVVSALPAAALAIVAGLLAASFLIRRKNAAYRLMLFRQIPDTLSLILRAVRAGLPVAEAIRSVSRESMSPTREEFQRVAAETALGMPIETTLQRLFERTRIQEYAFFSVVIGLHGQTGGNLSETIENLADMVRRRVAMVGKAKALAAEGRLSAIVVGALPFAVGGLISILNPGYMSEFVENPTGKVLVLAFAILLGLGLFTTHWITQRSTRD